MPTLCHAQGPFICGFSLNLHDNLAQKVLLLSFLLKKNHSSKRLFFKINEFTHACLFTFILIRARKIRVPCRRCIKSKIWPNVSASSVFSPFPRLCSIPLHVSFNLGPLPRGVRIEFKVQSFDFSEVAENHGGG